MPSATEREPQPGTGVLRLTLYDVRRNEAREIPLRFVSVRGSPHVLYAATAPPDWATQAKESSFIHWSIGSREVLGTARLVDNSTELRDEVLSLYESIVGPDTVRRWFGSEIGCIAFDESPEAVPYYRAVEAMFDESAPKYDRAVLTNPFDLHLRAVALESLRNLYRPGDRIIELGCGTGLESIPLAEAGIQVVALDISSGMLNELERKAETAGVRDRIETYRVPISKLGEIVSDLGPHSFDGAFSHFGALNCEPHLDRTPPVLRHLVKPAARISLGVWNRTCLSEMLWYGLAMRPGRALARLQSSVPVGRSRFGVPVFPHSPGEVERMFSPFFSWERTVGISVGVPPYDFGRRFVSHPKFVSFLKACDRTIRGVPFLRCLGDYFLLELRAR